MGFAASSFIRFSNNATLQNLIQRNLLRPSASAASGASVTQLLNAVTEPRLSSPFNTEKPTPYFNTLPGLKASCDAPDIMKKYNSDVSMIMLGLSGVDQQIHTRHRGGFDDDASDIDSGDEAFGDHDESVDEDNDADESDFDDDDDDDDFEEDSRRKRKF